MEGTITAYSGTSMTVSVTNSSGSGTIASWYISETGNVGAAGTNGTNGTNGAAGATGATGAAGTNGTNGSNGATGATGVTGSAGPGYYATSATSLTIASSGSVTLATQSGLAYVVGDRVRILSQSTATNYMEGTITAYSGTSMTVSVTNSSGSGTIASWYISETGNVGAAGTNGTNGTNGATGATGATGAAGTNGTNGTNGAAGATGATGATGFLSNGSAAGNTPYWNGTSWVVNSSNIYNNGGNVGIGTTTTNSTLSVKGSITMNGATSGYVGFAPAAAAGSTIWTLPSADGTSGQALTTNGTGTLSWSTVNGNAWSLTGNSGTTSANFIGTISNQSLYFRTNNTQWMEIDSLGDVGIGTTNFIRKFNIVQSDPAHGTVMVQNTSATGYSSIDFLDNSGTTEGNIGYSNPSASWNHGTFYFNTNTAAPMTFGVNSAEVFRLTNSSGTGYMGIGITSTPADRLTLNDGDLGINNDNNTAGNLKFYEPSTSGANYMSFKAQTMAANVTYTLPSADGSSGQFLSTDGSGNLSWSNAAGIGIPTYAFVTGSNFTTTATSLTNITGLSVALVAGAKYEIEAVMSDSASSNKWLNFGVNYTGTGTLAGIVNGLVDLGANGHDLCIQLSAFNTAYLPSGANGFCGVTGVKGGVLIHGIVTTTTAGSVTIEVENLGAQTATIYTGSFIKVTRIQ